MIVPILVFSAFMSGMSVGTFSLNRNTMESETMPVSNISYGEIIYEPIPDLPCAGVTKTLRSAKPRVLVSVVDMTITPEENEVIDNEYNLSDFGIDNVGYVSSTRLRIRKEPNTDSDIIGMLYFNDRVDYGISDNPNWVAIEYNGGVAFVSFDYIQDNYVGFKSLQVNNDRRKSYMDYKAINRVTSPQYRLQGQAVTDANGIRVVDGRYCIALGSYYSHNVGQYVDVVLENGTVIPCIIGDCKADCDTSDGNSVGNDGSVVEFIVDTPSLDSEVKSSGNCSKCSTSWDSEVKEIRLYNKDFI